MNKILSVIIPVYNMEKYLRECLDSLILDDPVAQLEIEVIIVNDGSKDNSLSIAREYEAQYPEIFSIIDKDNGGYGSAFNEGMKKVAGKYVTVLDSDDYFKTSELPQYITCLKERNEDIVVNNVKMFEDITNKDLGLYNKPIAAKSESISLKDVTVIPGHHFIHNFSFKPYLFTNWKCLENCLYTDTLMFAQGFKYAKSAFYSNSDLYCYRMNRLGQSVSKEVSLLKINDWEKITAELIKTSESYEDNKQLVLDLISNIQYRYILSLANSAIKKKHARLITQKKELKKGLSAIGCSFQHIKSKKVRLFYALPFLIYFKQLSILKFE